MLKFKKIAEQIKVNYVLHFSESNFTLTVNYFNSVFPFFSRIVSLESESESCTVVAANDPLGLACKT